ncbi:MAG: hypothetical protein E7621_01255 [Ruminococcaceae bacterium]|nr:hypothetical protein [Oscillospiraceae bacterium]
MNIDVLLRKNAVSFSVLLSGLSFWGLYTETQNVFSAAAITLLTLALVFLAVLVCDKVFKYSVSLKGAVKTPVYFVIFWFFAFLSCIFLYTAFTVELSKTQAIISGEFEGGRFSSLFAVLSLFLALYMGKRDAISISRIYFLLLPLLLLPYVITAFDFIGQGMDTKELLRGEAFIFDIKYIVYPLSSFGGVLLLFPLTNENGKGPGKSKLSDFLWAFIFMAVFCVLEYAKYIVWFGKSGLEFINRPDRTMLSQVPFMNIQEIYLVSYYTAYMLKISLFCTCARKYFEKILKKFGLKEISYVRAGYIVTAAFCIISYTLSFIFEEKISFIYLCPAAIALIFAVILLQGILRIIKKRLFAAKRYRNLFKKA